MSKNKIRNIGEQAISDDTSAGDVFDGRASQDISLTGTADEQLAAESRLTAGTAEVDDLGVHEETAAEKRAREPRTLDEELQRLADKHSKRVTELRNALAKLEQRKAALSKELTEAEAPLQRIADVLGRPLTAPAPEPLPIPTHDVPPQNPSMAESTVGGVAADVVVNQ